MSHESTQEKSYLLFGVDCCSPVEATLLPPSQLKPTDVRDDREELRFSLSLARTAAAIQKTQARYKKQYAG